MCWSFNMDWRILVFYPEPEARKKFTNIRQSMLKLKSYFVSDMSKRVQIR
jgi:hypothetical protein